MLISKSPRLLRVALLASAAALCASAEVTLPAILGEHMVLQRGRPVHIWGKAAPDEPVSVTFRGETRSAKTDALGRWSVYLLPAEAGGPYDLTVKGVNEIAFKDILVGDVWVASGQSNMEFALRQTNNAAAEIAAANYPKLRMVKVNKKVSDYPLEDTPVRPWTACTPETAPAVSAVAFFFARHLQEKLGGVPIGILESNWGGTPASAWTSLHGLSDDPALMPVFANWAKTMEAYPDAQIKYERALQVWQAAADKAKADGTQPPPRPNRPQSTAGGEWTPAGLYNGMIAPITPFPIRGVIWYQGENDANVSQSGVYARLFQAMIRDWRRAWGEGDFPFLFVQLANYKANPYWADLRDAQRQALSLANTGMAVTIDIGNPTNVHPTNKQDVGLRLALAARAVVFGEKLEYSGPLFSQATHDGAQMRIFFDHVGGGLVAKGDGLKGFEIAGADRKFVPAEARIDGATIVVTSATVAAPLYVRYAWADNPDCNLYNADGLPASPFRSAE